MKLACLFMIVGFLSSTFAAIPGLNMGLVDLQKALQSVDAGKNAKTSLEKEVASKRAELEKQQKTLQDEMEQFEKKAAIMNESAKMQKQAEIQKRVAEFQKNMAESQMDLQKKERELTKPLIDELRAIIQGVGKEKNFQLIMEKNEGAVLYAEGATDLTSVVIDRFNAKHKGKAADKAKKS
ncbi:MAG: OmpH family outer membrane protein [Deltaproteobacteria bacterium]|nr:OmpH family outer membrane protein [Deltaproteobacteria bacterium]